MNEYDDEQDDQELFDEPEEYDDEPETYSPIRADNPGQRLAFTVSLIIGLFSCAFAQMTGILK